jgi:hypothetical protein
VGHIAFSFRADIFCWHVGTYLPGQKLRILYGKELRTLAIPSKNQTRCLPNENTVHCLYTSVRKVAALTRLFKNCTMGNFSIFSLQ